MYNDLPRCPDAPTAWHARRYANARGVDKQLKKISAFASALVIFLRRYTTLYYTLSTNVNYYTLFSLATVE